MRTSNLRHLSYSHINQAPKKIAMNATSLSLYISQFLSTSKGRDKFMAVLQYAFDFYHSCTKHTNIPDNMNLVLRQELKCLFVAEKFKDSISQSRKVFRLLYFLDEIKGIQRILKQRKPILFKLLSLGGHYASFMYYVSDNLLWIIAVLIKSSALKREAQHLWKKRKNTFSLMRIFLNVIRLLVILIMRERKEYLLTQRLFQEILTGEQQKKVQLSLIKLRRKKRFEMLDLILSILRFFMLTKSLRLTGYQYLDPVFVASCGLASSGIALFKAIYEKKIFIKLESQQSKGEEKQLIKGFASSSRIGETM